MVVEDEEAARGVEEEAVVESDEKQPRLISYIVCNVSYIDVDVSGQRRILTVICMVGVVY